MAVEIICSDQIYGRTEDRTCDLLNTSRTAHPNGVLVQVTVKSLDRTSRFEEDFKRFTVYGMGMVSNLVVISPSMQTSAGVSHLWIYWV